MIQSKNSQDVFAIDLYVTTTQVARIQHIWNAHLGKLNGKKHLESHTSIHICSPYPACMYTAGRLV